ncbi:MAG: archaemetzincin [Candidatus Omnitrophica bacterium]|nr:archaemetzincin [Candidatus Omnitrophota bacterium]MDD5670066.1 archaemetzincin [Candidatus Omnitrophota bacterium]
MKTIQTILGLCIVALLLTAMTFTPPNAKERQQALGSLRKLPKPLQKALKPDADFVPLPRPEAGDWLTVHSEKGQTYKDFVRSRFDPPTAARNIIVLQPLGSFPEGSSPSLEILKEYESAFFGLKAENLPIIEIEKNSFNPRTNSFTKETQIQTGRVLDFLKSIIPADAFALLAITMTDLYPEPSWNFVFGESMPADRVGVFSFSRYNPLFAGKTQTDNPQFLLLKRSMKVLTHETGHMFGLAHCIYFHCVMNGSNHLEESDKRPFHLCPVCLRKLQDSTQFNVVERYAELARLYQKWGLEEEARWTLRQLKKIHS